jgi:hypothetical protein
MDENLKYWFKGFENAIAHMKQEERESLFCECGKNCADRWVLNLYRDLYNKVNGDMDLFFTYINGGEDVKGEIVEPSKKYNLFFTKCLCDLHNAGYVNNPCLCECSRQSIIYVFNTLMPNKNFNVEICSTVLGGRDECKFSITINN